MQSIRHANMCRFVRRSEAANANGLWYAVKERKLGVPRSQQKVAGEMSEIEGASGSFAEVARSAKSRKERQIKYCPQRRRW